MQFISLCSSITYEKRHNTVFTRWAISSWLLPNILLVLLLSILCTFLPYLLTVSNYLDETKKKTNAFYSIFVSKYSLQSARTAEFTISFKYCTNFPSLSVVFSHMLWGHCSVCHFLPHLFMRSSCPFPRLSCTESNLNLRIATFYPVCFLETFFQNNW